MINIELDDSRAEQFKRFCQYEQDMINIQENWKQVRKYAENLQFGAFTLIIKDGMPVRIDNPMQQVVLGTITKIKF